MFQFTNDGEAVNVDVASIEAQVESLDGSDLQYLPIMVRAAVEADRAGYCHVYDEIASSVGAPTRDELKEAGLLPLDRFTVNVTRTVRVNVGEIDVPVSFTVRDVEALRPGDIRDDFRRSDAVNERIEAAWQEQFADDTVTGVFVRNAINYYGRYATVEQDGDEIEVTSVERQDR